jgi:hypothetical protein
VLLDWRVHKQKFVRIFCVVFPEGRFLVAVFPSTLADILGIDGLYSLLWIANTNDSTADLLCQANLHKFPGQSSATHIQYRACAVAWLLKGCSSRKGRFSPAAARKLLSFSFVLAAKPPERTK